MNELVLALGLADWKPLASTLVLPPTPFLLLVLWGAWLLPRRRALGWTLLLLAILGLWLTSTAGLSRAVMQHLLNAPPELREAELAALKREPQSERNPKTAIVVLGGGRRIPAPEYGTATLHPRSVERLRYGIWLSRETGLPLAFSGGIGRGGETGPTEAELAQRIAEQEFGRPLRWLENSSRDTHENASNTVALLRAQGVERIVLVTHAYHLPRALKNFEQAAMGSKMQLLPAPTGGPGRGAWKWTDWLPSHRGVEENRLVWHEWLGLLTDA